MSKKAMENQSAPTATYTCGACGVSMRMEQPAQQEPVAVVSGYYGGQCVILPIDPARIFNSNTPLYTTPQAQPTREFVWLTLEEIKELKNLPGANRERTATEMAFAVRNKLMEKNK